MPGVIIYIRNLEIKCLSPSSSKTGLILQKLRYFRLQILTSCQINIHTYIHTCIYRGGIIETSSTFQIGSDINLKCFLFKLYLFNI